MKYSLYFCTKFCAKLIFLRTWRCNTSRHFILFCIFFIIFNIYMSWFLLFCLFFIIFNSFIMCIFKNFPFVLQLLNFLSFILHSLFTHLWRKLRYEKWSTLFSFMLSVSYWILCPIAWYYCKLNLTLSISFFGPKHFDFIYIKKKILFSPFSFKFIHLTKHKLNAFTIITYITKLENHLADQAFLFWVVWSIKCKNTCT